MSYKYSQQVNVCSKPGKATTRANEKGFQTCIASSLFTSQTLNGICQSCLYGLETDGDKGDKKCE